MEAEPAVTSDSATAPAADSWSLLANTLGIEPEEPSTVSSADESGLSEPQLQAPTDEPKNIDELTSTPTAEIAGEVILEPDDKQNPKISAWDTAATPDVDEAAEMLTSLFRPVQDDEPDDSNPIAEVIEETSDIEIIDDDDDAEESADSI